MPVLLFLSAGRVTQSFGQSLVTAASSVLTATSSARLSSFDKRVAVLHNENNNGKKKIIPQATYDKIKDQVVAKQK